MKALFKFIFRFSIIFLICYFVLISVSNRYLWPKITECPCCRHAIWAWQDYGPLTYNIEVKSNTVLPAGVKLTAYCTAFFHKDCSRPPKDEFLCIRGFDEKTGEAWTTFMGTIRPKQSLHVVVVQEDDSK